MTDAIHLFLDDRKEQWLKERVKKVSGESEILELNQEADEKFSLEQWLPDASKRVSQLFMVSHPSKFSHPSSKTSSVIAQAKSAQDGYLRSGNVEYDLDVFGNAAAMDVFKFLSLELEDGVTVLDGFEQDNADLKTLVKQAHLDFDAMKQAFLGIKEDDSKGKTDHLVKQVYIPIGENQYHLLSILTPSGLITRLKKIIEVLRFSDATKEAKENRKANELDEVGFADIYDLTVTAYGGTKPQNISVLNNLNAGRAYLLPSVPPVFKKRKERLPNANFFTQCLFLNDYQEGFIQLNKLIKSSKNNAEIRAEIKNTIQFAIDQLLLKAFKVRESAPENWSEQEYYSGLPMLQRIWLDSAFEQEREDGDWRSEMSETIALWYVSNYERTIKKSCELGVDEINAVKQYVEESLQPVKGFL